MKLGAKSMCIAVGMVISMLLILWVGGLIVRQGFLQLEETYSRVNAERAVRQIEVSAEELGAVVADWARWDDTYQFAADRNADYEASNLLPDTFSVLNIQLLLILDVTGAEVWGECFLQGEALPVSSELLARLQPGHGLLERALSGTEFYSGVVLLDEGPMVLAISPILTSRVSGPARGVLVMGRWLTEDALTQLAAPLHLELRAFRTDRIEPDSNLGEVQMQLSDLGSVCTLSSTPHIISSFSIINGIDEEPALLIQADMERDIFQQGRRTLLFLLILLVAGGIGAIGIAFFLIRKTIVRPLEHLTRATLEAADGNLDVFVPTFGYDELGGLAAAFNTLMFCRREVEAEREQLLTAIDQLAEAVVITTVSGVVEYVNPAFESITGYRSEDVVGESMRVMNAGERDEEFIARLNQTLLKGEAWSGRLTRRKQDGTLYTEDSVISPVRNAHGKIVNYVAVIRDVTERIALEEQVRQSQKMQSIGQLVGGIAHDFNNLLQVINGSAEMAMILMESNQSADECVRDIKDAGDHASRHVQQLLEFSRQQVIDPEPIQLNQEVPKLLGELRRLCGDSVQLEWTAGGSLEPVWMDRRQLRQVLINLCENALDAMPDGGTISVQTESISSLPAPLRQKLFSKSGRYVLLRVSDTGCGMRPEVRSRIFEPFFTTKPFGESSGMGLASVFGAVSQSSGWIEVESSPGNGAQFLIYLPIYSGSEDEGRNSGSLVDKKKKRQDGKATILLVEDDPRVMKLSLHTLQHVGYQVLTAEDGVEAVSVFAQHADEIDLVMMDVVMPHMGGRQAMEKIRELQPDVRSIYVSGYSPDAGHDGFVKESGEVFLGKPYPVNTLLKVVRDVLAVCPE